MHTGCLSYYPIFVLIKITIALNTFMLAVCVCNLDGLINICKCSSIAYVMCGLSWRITPTPFILRPSHSIRIYAIHQKELRIGWYSELFGCKSLDSVAHVTSPRPHTHTAHRYRHIHTQHTRFTKFTLLAKNVSMLHRHRVQKHHKNRCLNTHLNSMQSIFGIAIQAFSYCVRLMPTSNLAKGLCVCVCVCQCWCGCGGSISGFHRTNTQFMLGFYFRCTFAAVKWQLSACTTSVFKYTELIRYTTQCMPATIWEYVCVCVTSSTHYTVPGLSFLFHSSLVWCAPESSQKHSLSTLLIYFRCLPAYLHVH